MRKKIAAVALAAVVLTCSSAYIIKSSTGLAGYTGSPGEVTCGTFGCHGGGAGSAPAIVINATPSIAQGEYMPDSVYQISIGVSAAGYTRFGFGCEVLGLNNANAGVMQAAGPGVKFMNAFNGRMNATHTTPKIGANVLFNFQWVAPSTPDTVAFYVMANAVNGNGNTSGDRPSAPFSLSLTPKAAPVDTTTQDTSTVGIRELAPVVRQVRLYPSPASDFAQLSYHLQSRSGVEIELCDIKGQAVKDLFHDNCPAGDFSRIIDLRGVEKGVYFVSISADGNKIARKMLIVQ